MKMLYVHGREYAANDFEEHFGEDECLKLWEIAMETESKEIEVGNSGVCEEFQVKAYEFGEVSQAFIDFLQFEILDYDESKHSNFYFVEEE